MLAGSSQVQLAVKEELEERGLIVADGAANPGEAGCDSWAARNGVIAAMARFGRRSRIPVPSPQRESRHSGTAALGHFRTHAVQQYAAGYSSNRSDGWSIRKRVVQARRSSSSVFPSS
jgi:hypothetical protein